MSSRPKASSPATDPQDSDDLGLSGEFSITSILEDELFIDELSDEDDTINSFDPLPDFGGSISETPAPAPRTPAREPTIDELLEACGDDDSNGATERNRSMSDTGLFGPREDLLPPEAMFPKRSEK